MSVHVRPGAGTLMVLLYTTSYLDAGHQFSHGVGIAAVT